MSATVHGGRSGGACGVAAPLVVVAGSMGGLPALTELVEGLIECVRLPITIVQHRPMNGTEDRLARILARRTTLPVRSAEQSMSATVGGITVIPGGLEAAIDSRRCYQLSYPASRHRADPLFTSAAGAMGSDVIGVILSGRLDDGREGVRHIKRHGGRVIAQDPDTAIAPEMPAHAIATGCVDFVLPAARIPAALVAMTVAPGGSRLLQVPTPPWARFFTPDDRPGRHSARR